MRDVQMTFIDTAEAVPPSETPNQHVQPRTTTLLIYLCTPCLRDARAPPTPWPPGTPNQRTSLGVAHERPQKLTVSVRGSAQYELEGHGGSETVIGLALAAQPELREQVRCDRPLRLVKSLLETVPHIAVLVKHCLSVALPPRSSSRRCLRQRLALRSSLGTAFLSRFHCALSMRHGP